MIPPIVALSPLLAPVLLEALGPRRARPARRLLFSLLFVAAIGLGVMALAGPVAALASGAGASFLVHWRARRVGPFAAVVDVALVSLFAAVVCAAVDVVLSSPSLTLSTLGSAAGVAGAFLIRGRWLALSGVGR